MTTVDKPREKVQESRSETSPALRRGTTPQLVTGGVMILIGLLWLLERTGAVDLNATAVLAIGTMIVGISLMVLARRGPHTGLIVFGTALGLITLLTATAPLEGFQGGVGDRSVEVTSVEDIEPDYNLSMGTLTVDVSELENLNGATSLSASVGMGELVVRVPEGIAIEVKARSGAGEVRIFDRSADGMGVNETYRSPGFADEADTLTLDVSVFLGTVEVTNE